METEEIKKMINIGDKDYELIAYLNLDSGNYIVYTDGKHFENGQVALYVNCVTYIGEEMIFDEVLDEELKQVINALRERLVNNE